MEPSAAKRRDEMRHGKELKLSGNRIIFGNNLSVLLSERRENYHRRRHTKMGFRDRRQRKVAAATGDKPKAEDVERTVQIALELELWLAYRCAVPT